MAKKTKKAKKLKKVAKVKNLSCKLECPHCHEHWADLKYTFDASVNSKDVRVLEGDPFKDGDELVCRKCQYKYTNWDILLAIAAANTTGKGEKDEDKEVHI